MVLTLATAFLCRPLAAESDLDTVTSSTSAAELATQWVRELGSADAAVRAKAQSELEKASPEVVAALPALDNPLLSLRQRDALRDTILKRWNRQVDDRLRGTTLQWPDRPMTWDEIDQTWKQQTGHVFEHPPADAKRLLLLPRTQARWECLAYLAKEEHWGKIESASAIAAQTPADPSAPAVGPAELDVHGGVAFAISEVEPRPDGTNEFTSGPSVGLRVMFDPKIPWMYGRFAASEFTVTPTENPQATIFAGGGGMTTRRPFTWGGKTMMSLLLGRVPDGAGALSIKGNYHLGMPLHLGEVSLPLADKNRERTTPGLRFRVLSVSESSSDAEADTKSGSLAKKGSAAGLPPTMVTLRCQLQRLIDVPLPESHLLVLWSQIYRLEFANGRHSLAFSPGDVPFSFHESQGPVEFDLRFAKRGEIETSQLKGTIPLGLAERAVPLEFRRVPMPQARGAADKAGAGPK